MRAMRAKSKSITRDIFYIFIARYYDLNSSHLCHATLTSLYEHTHTEDRISWRDIIIPALRSNPHRGRLINKFVSIPVAFAFAYKSLAQISLVDQSQQTHFFMMYEIQTDQDLPLILSPFLAFALRSAIAIHAIDELIRVV